MRNLFRAAIKTGAGTTITILMGIISTKVFALGLGPDGFGVLSLLRQVRQTAMVVASLGGNTALVQGLASRVEKEKVRYLATVFWFYVSASSIVLIVFVFFSGSISRLTFGSTDQKMVVLVRWLTLPILLTVSVNFISGLLNGYRAIGRLALIQIVAAMVTALVSYPVANRVQLGHPNAFIVMMVLAQLSALIYGLWVAYRENWITPLINWWCFSLSDAKHFLSIAGTSMVTGLMITLTSLSVRAMIVQQRGLGGVGIFDVAWTLSMSYIMLVLGSLGTYYMPTLSATRDSRERTKLMANTLRFITLIIVPVLVAIIVLKPFVVKLLYSDEFSPALTIIRWMLIGDYLKATSWVFTMPMLSYADMSTFFCAELFWNVGFLVFATVSIVGFDSLEGLGIGFVAIYSAYLFYGVYYARVRHGFSFSGKLLTNWLVGLAFVICVSVATWDDSHLDLLKIGFWLVAASGFSWFSLQKSERENLSHRFKLQVKKVSR